MNNEKRQHQPRPMDVALLRLVVEGVTNPLDLGVPQRLTILRARYGSSPTVGPMVRAAWDALLRAQDHVDEATDRAYLESLIDGSGDLLSEETFPKLEPMFTRYAEGTPMFALLEQAATVFGDAVQELACWVLAGTAIDEARRDEDKGSA